MTPSRTQLTKRALVCCVACRHLTPSSTMLGARARGRLQQRLTKAQSIASMGAHRAKELSTIAAAAAAKHSAVAFKAARATSKRAATKGWQESKALASEGGALAKGAASATAMKAARSWRYAKSTMKEKRDDFKWDAIKPRVYMDDKCKITVEFGPPKPRLVPRKLLPGDGRRESELPEGTAASCAAFLCMIAAPCMLAMMLLWESMSTSTKVYMVCMLHGPLHPPVKLTRCILVASSRFRRSLAW